MYGPFGMLSLYVHRNGESLWCVGVRDNELSHNVYRSFGIRN